MDAAVCLDLPHQLASQDLHLTNGARLHDLRDQPIDAGKGLWMPARLSDGRISLFRSTSRLLTIPPPIPASKTYQALIIRSPIVATPDESVNSLFRPRP
jgi:hypothetical protein